MKLKVSGKTLLDVVWMGWGIDIWLWRKYLVLSWCGKRWCIYWSRNATPWAADWILGWNYGRFLWFQKESQ